MRKGDLKNYVEVMINKKVDEVNSLIQKKVDEVSSKAIAQLKSNQDLKQVEQLAEQLAEAAFIVMDRTPIREYSIGNIRSEFGNIIEFMSNRIKVETYGALRDNNFFTSYYSYGTTIVEDVAAAQKEMKPLREKLEQLNRLRSEVANIIRNEPSGKRAYKALIAAGLDMTGFVEEASANLPAVVKLSVDPSILKEEV